jgi:hypothetical protein
LPSQKLMACARAIALPSQKLMACARAIASPSQKLMACARDPGTSADIAAGRVTLGLGGAARLRASAGH